MGIALELQTRLLRRLNLLLRSLMDDLKSEVVRLDALREADRFEQVCAAMDDLRDAVAASEEREGSPHGEDLEAVEKADCLG